MLVPCNGLRCKIDGKYKKVKPGYLCERYIFDDVFGISAEFDIDTDCNEKRPSVIESDGISEGN